MKLAEINLEKHGNLSDIFGTNDLDIIIPELELLVGTSHRQANTLLFTAASGFSKFETIYSEIPGPWKN